MSIKSVVFSAIATAATLTSTGNAAAPQDIIDAALGQLAEGRTLTQVRNSRLERRRNDQLL